MSPVRTALALCAFAFGATAGAQAERGPPPERTLAPPETASDEFAVSAYRVFDARDGLPQATVDALVQDREGTVYAGTEDGVAQFDGLRWLPLRMPAAVAPSDISDLLVDADDVLWAADDVFGVLRRDASGALRAMPFEGGGVPAIEALARATDGVWASSPQGLFRCDATLCRRVAALGARPTAALLAGDGPNGPCLWLGIEYEGLFRLDDPDSAQPQLVGPLLTKADGLPNDSLRSLAQWHGDLWIGTGRGIARWSGSRLIVYSRDSGFGDGIVRAMQPGHDAHGQPRLLATQWPGGVIEIRPDGSWQRLGTRNGLPEDSAIAVLDVQPAPGRPGALWIGTVYSGIVRQEPGNWQAMDERAGLPHRAIIGMGRVALPGKSPRYWLGTVRGSVAWQGGRWEPWLPYELRGDTVFAVHVLGEDTWLATGRGLFRWRADGTLDVYNTHTSALQGLMVLSLTPQQRRDASTRLWYTTRHGLGWVEDGVLHADPEPTRMLDSSWFRVIVESDIGRPGATLWAGGSGGVVFDRGHGWETLARDCLPHPDVMDLRLQSDASGREMLWAGTRGGIARIDPRTFACTRIDASQLGKPLVYQIQFDRRGRLYAFGFDGVRRLTFATPDLADIAIEHIGIADGLPSLEFNRSSFVDTQGRIWGGSTGGLAIYDPMAEVPAGVAAPLRLLDANANGQPLGAGVRLAAAQNNLHFDYRLLTARREHRNRYRTELAGLDAKPGEWTDASSVEYSRVPPGDYTFRVWSQDEFGTVAGPEELRFGIAYPVWRQPAAWAGYALLLIGFGVGIGRWRARSFAQRAQALEQTVGTRTAELAEANRQLERASLTDPLTGLWNRRQFYESLPSLLATSPCLALLLIDIDHFKRINDSHGHDAGDAVLREFATRLRGFVREGELALRWGGEEFLLALPDHAAAPAALRAAELLALIRDSDFVTDSGRLAVTCSIGWLGLPWLQAGGANASIDQALALADAGLYRAKELGRARAIGVLPGRADDPRPQPHLPPVRFVEPDPAVSTLVPFRR